MASSPHDTIVIENDFSGKIKAFRADDLILEGGNVINASPLPGNTATLQGKDIIQKSSKIFSEIFMNHYEQASC